MRLDAPAIQITLLDGAGRKSRSWAPDKMSHGNASNRTALVQWADADSS